MGKKCRLKRQETSKKKKASEITKISPTQEN